jgi:SAM-dependent methyltransferase
MVRHPDEAYYARQYLHWILPELENRFPSKRVDILDIGCGQGRLSIPSAQWTSGRVVGVDLTPAAVAAAEKYVQAQGLTNIRVYHSDLLPFVRGLGDSSVDIVLFIEVSFFLPSLTEVLQEVARVLKPTGLLFASFRSQFFNLLQTIRARLWDAADDVITEREGHIFGGPVLFTWQTPEDAKRMLSGVGLRLCSLRGIGVCSGVKGDPLASIAQPSRLSPQEQERLMKLECGLAEEYVQLGRYMLAIAEK